MKKVTFDLPFKLRGNTAVYIKAVDSSFEWFYSEPMKQFPIINAELIVRGKQNKTMRL